MNARAREARTTLRQRTRTNRATSRAARRVATGTPQPARTHLLAAGLDPATAKRYSGAFSNGVTPTATAETKVKLRRDSRRTKRVPVKLYDRAAFAARLAVYRPRDTDAAAKFAALAYRLAA